MKKLYSVIRLLPVVAAAALPISANAEWGTPEAPRVLLSSGSEIASVKTARTADGKTFVSWLAWSERSGWGYNLHLQLVDADGEPLWGPEGIEVEDVRNASWTADYWMVVTPEGDAILSWADARNEEDAETAYGHVSVLYKVSQDQEMLWGERGIELGEKYKYPATLYQFGADTYCIMQSAEDWGTPQITRLAADGSFELEPKDFAGQLIQSEDGDFISVYGASEGTVAMRYNRDIEPVWNAPALLSTYIYNGYARQGYRVESDGHGGAVVSFSRELGMFSHLPVIAYVTADGEAVFGESADVIVTEENDHNYNVIGVNTDEETILSVWQISSGRAALGAQLMDFFGERLWGDEGKLLASKEGGSGYSYGPIAAYPLANANWFVVYADELWWGHNDLYYATFDGEGNQLTCQKSTEPTGVDDYSTYMEGQDFYMFYLNEYSDDNWESHYEITTVKIENISTGVNNVAADAAPAGKAEYYNIAGQRLAKPAAGLNIVREADGTIHKVIVK